MGDYELKDYRATHFLMRLIRSNVQGWYSKENILLLANHHSASEEKLNLIKNLIDTVNGWNNMIEPETTPFIMDDGTINNPDLAEDVCSVLFQLFEQYAQMNVNLNSILDVEEPLQNRKEDFQYIVACLGWVYYAINHTVHGDISFADKFSDQELKDARAGQIEESQKELNFVNYLVNSFNDEETYNAKSCEKLINIIETHMDEDLKNTAIQLDKYLIILGQ